MFSFWLLPLVERWSIHILLDMFTGKEHTLTRLEKLKTVSPTQLLSTDAASYCLSLVSSLFTPVASVVMTVNSISWVLIHEFLPSGFCGSWLCVVNFCCQPTYRILHLSVLCFNILISILFHSLSRRPFWVLMLSSIMLTLLSIELSTYLISILVWFSLSVSVSAWRQKIFQMLSVKDLLPASQLLCVTLWVWVCHQEFALSQDNVTRPVIWNSGSQTLVDTSITCHICKMHIPRPNLQLFWLSRLEKNPGISAFNKYPKWLM